MQNSTHRQDVVPGATDPELERMLDDAYEVPPLPRSLLKRIDRCVEQEWGVSPELSRREPSRLRGAVARFSRLSLWSIAASLVFVVVTVVIVHNHAHAYGWSKMMDALSRAGVVRFAAADDSTIRWMSVSKAVLGERSAARTRIYDFGRHFVLERDEGAAAGTMRSLAGAAGASPQEAVVIAFLVNNLALDGDAIRQTDLRVTGERWSSVGKNVLLEVELAAVGEAVELRILVDRQTHLPQRFELAGSQLSPRRATLSYLQSDGSELLARDFPAELPIVEGVAATTVAAPDPRTAAESSPSAIAAIQPPAAEKPLPPAAPLVGAATLQWKAVARSDRAGAAAVGAINTILEKLWRDHDVQPSADASDAELLRRVYLDLAGRTPSVSEVRAFLADHSPDRYATLVDDLLASRDHATHLATAWRTYLIPEGIDLSRFGGPQSFEKWIGDQFIDGVPYDEIVRRLLLAEGRLTESGPLLFYAAVKLDPDQLATRSARVFLGMRLDCAQCHDDHFEPWLQDDFWAYAAFFAQISRPQGVLNDVSTVMQVRDVDRGEVTLPDSETVVAPRFLDGSPIDHDARSVTRRRQLAEWLTAADNPFFARATANRVWGLLFGKGIVEPVDGFGVQHKPVSQELLDELASQFYSSGYDLRALFRTIVLSRAYRLSSGAETPDPRRRELFAQMNVKLLTAEQMYDCITVASMLVSAEAGTGFNLARVGNASRDEFLQQFRAPPGRSTEYQAGIPQALTLMNGELITSATGLASSGLLKSLEIPLITNEERVEILFLATLSRQPTPSERELLSEYIREEASGDELYESLADVLWALLNSGEFTMNH